MVSEADSCTTHLVLRLMLAGSTRHLIATVVPCHVPLYTLPNCKRGVHGTSAVSIVNLAADVAQSPLKRLCTHIACSDQLKQLNALALCKPGGGRLLYVAANGCNLGPCSRLAKNISRCRV